MKKIIWVFLGVVFLASFKVASASLMINEIMYDLSGSDTTNSKSREWIEIYNSDANSISIDAGTWRIFDGSANRTINDQVNFSIPAGAYVIWAGDKDTFLADHAGFSGVVYDTGITSLNNTGATLKILDQDGSAVDSVTYASTQGAAGDGNSLQKISGSWVGATPTPGVANGSTSSISSSTSGEPVRTSNDSPSSTTTETKTKTAEQPKIRAQITGRTLAFVGIPLELEGNAFGYSGEKLYYGKYFWNFGDGDSREIKTIDAKKFTHTYFYAGEYIVSLEYYMNYYAEIPDASSKIIIKVIPTDILISKVGDEKDFFVGLSNNTDYDADLSGWFLLSDSKSFSFPRNTILEPEKKMIVSSRITNFSVEDKNTLRLVTPQREVVFDYLASTVPAKVVIAKTAISPKVVRQDKDNNLAEVQNPVPAESLVASAVSSDVIPQKSGKSYIPVIISFIFIGTSASAVYFIRQKKIIPKTGDDFRILDE